MRYYYDNIIVESRLSTETETILRHVLYSQCQSSWPKSKRYFRGEYKLDKSFRIYTASMILYDILERYVSANSFVGVLFLHIYAQFIRHCSRKAIILTSPQGLSWLHADNGPLITFH